ncbi:MAG: OpgC domain-containing protein [Alphaproteobacteria bacterium]|nr:OpgC domain-containing protein [Alphaproteobacteria bacterium]
MQKTSRQKRITGIDICRSVAILLAMFSHSLIEFNFYEFRDFDTYAPFRFAIQMAPPIFICLFGAMLEIVYKPQFERGDKEAVFQKLFNRAIQCYVLYVVTLLAQFAMGQISLGYMLRCALMIGVSPYADILKFYAVALALSPWLISLRVTYGPVYLLGAALAVHLLFPVLQLIPKPPLILGKDYLGMPAGFLYGGGEGVGGPSILHGMTFVVIGMIIGRAVLLSFDDQSAIRRKGAAILGALFVCSLAISALLWDFQAPFQTIRNIADMSLRNLNHPIYFSLGISATIFCVVICIWLFDVQKYSWARWISFLGKASLFTFSFGNILLYAAPDVGVSKTTSLIFSLIALFLICLQTYVFIQLVAPGQTGRTSEFGGLKTAFQKFVQMLQFPLQNLSELLASKLTSER